MLNVFCPCFSNKNLPDEGGNVDNNKASPNRKEPYSWDKRREIGNLSSKKLFFKNESEKVLARPPNSVNGDQFTIANCKNCVVYLFDWMTSVFVDDCINCKLFIGPVKTSVFIRNCSDCQMMLACQQFRTRDCYRVDVGIACVSNPIIEATSRIRFGPFLCNYPELRGQFEAAQLNPFNSCWWQIHDFTPCEDAGDKNFSFLKLKNVDATSSPSAFEGGKSIKPNSLGLVPYLEAAQDELAKLIAKSTSAGKSQEVHVLEQVSISIEENQSSDATIQQKKKRRFVLPPDESDSTDAAPPEEPVDLEHLMSIVHLDFNMVNSFVPYCRGPGAMAGSSGENSVAVIFDCAQQENWARQIILQSSENLTPCTLITSKFIQLQAVEGNKLLAYKTTSQSSMSIFEEYFHKGPILLLHFFGQNANQIISQCVQSILSEKSKSSSSVNQIENAKINSSRHQIDKKQSQASQSDHEKTLDIDKNLIQTSRNASFADEMLDQFHSFMHMHMNT